jgi:hypothetical protein
MQFIEITAAAWVGYNTWRVFNASGNAIEVSSRATAACPKEFSYNTYAQIREYYLELSTAHKKYEVCDSSPGEEAVFNVWETAGFQFVKHRYRIVDVIPLERMRLVSENSEVAIFGIFRSRTRSEVEFCFSDAPGNTTTLGLTIRIVFTSPIRQLLARVFFTEYIWQAHAREEMAALARLMQKRYSGGTGAVMSP